VAQTDRAPDRRIFQQLFGETRQPAFAYSAKTFEVLDANSAALAAFGVSRRKLVGASLLDRSAPDQAVLNRRRLVNATSESIKQFRLAVKRTDGTISDLRGFTTPISYAGQGAELVLLDESTASLRQLARIVTERSGGRRRQDREVRRHVALTEFARAALGGLDHQSMVKAASKLLRDSLAIDFCLGFELREREGDLACVAAEGWEGDTRSLHLNPTGDTFAARALRCRSAVSAEHIEPETQPEESAWFFKRFDLHAAIGIPIRLGDVSFGSIVAYSRKPRRFDESEIRYIETVADVIAIAADRERAKTDAAMAAQRVGDVLESIVEHFVHVNHDWRISFVNVTVPGLFSRPARDIVGQPVADWFPSFRDTKCMAYYEAAMFRGQTSMFEFKSDLNGRHYEARVRPTPEGIGVYFLDITERRFAEEARLDQERRAHLLIGNMPAITWTTDADLTLLTSNGGGLRGLGLKDGELVGRSLREMFPHPRSATIIAHERALGGESCNYMDDFGSRNFHSHVEPLRDADGKVFGVAGLTIDITERVVADARLAEAQSVAHFGTWSFDLNAGERIFSDELLRILGRRESDMPRLFADAAMLVPEEDREQVVGIVRRALARDEAWNFDHRVAGSDGTIRYVQNAGRCFRAPDGTAIRGFGSVLDITERKLAEQELTRLATVDVLTSLPNRTQITARIAQIIGAAEERGRSAAVCCLDIDRFKSINHSLGHAAGDDVLKAVGQRLGSVVRPGDIVGRLGSDEFVVVFADVRSDADSGILAGKLKSAFVAPIEAGGREQFVTVSAGMSFFPADGDVPEELLRHADAALYAAKDAGGDRAIAYSPAMQVASSARLEMQNSLHRALERMEFCVYYQPIIDCVRRKLVGFEALVRWQHPTLGLVPPNDFIPLAEQTGLIVPIGAWVLRSACSAATRWQRPGRPSLWVSVNLSARQFAEGSLVDTVKSALLDSALPAENLSLEVTESTVVRDVHGGAAILRSLGAMGVGIAIDDFGTGYSSLGYLRSFAFDTLKIDRSFVRGLPESAEDGSIARGIIALGQALGMRVTAEGVETEEQAEFLSTAHCDMLQGFLISKPVPEDELAALIASLTD
jgi:diguanylate cyclase (GGDEF)-like protein/PAS domain S-box-containing protein